MPSDYQMYFLPERSRSTCRQARALLNAALPSIIVDPHLCLNLNTLKNQEGLKITANLDCAHPCCKRLVSTIKVALPPEDLPPKLGFWTGSHQKENQDSINSGQDQTFHSTLLGIFWFSTIFAWYSLTGESTRTINVWQFPKPLNAFETWWYVDSTL